MNALSDLIHIERFARLKTFAVLSVTGLDRESFLQGQLTHDVAGLSLGQHQLSGYCSPKGRLLAVMRQWKDETRVYHLLPHEIAQDTAKRLRMFVLRSKATITLTEVADAQSSALAIIGVYGRCADSFAVGQAVPIQEGFLLRAPDCPVMGSRAWLIAGLQEAQPALKPAALDQATELQESAWLDSEIQAGLPWVGLATREAFVPQMVNLELVDGVSFTKGCYTGQEVVARSQYLGKLKRRMFRVDLEPAHGMAPEQLAGCDVWSDQLNRPKSVGGEPLEPGDSAEPVGRVVMASTAHNPAGEPLDRISLLIECTLQGWAAQGLHLQSVNGPALKARALPYEITEPS